MSRTLCCSSMMLMLIFLCSKNFLDSEMFAVSRISTNVSVLRFTPYFAWVKSGRLCHYPLSFSLPSYLNYKAPSHSSSSLRLSSTSPPHNLSTTQSLHHYLLSSSNFDQPPSLLVAALTTNSHYATKSLSKSSRLPHASLSQLISILQPSTYRRSHYF